MVVSCASARIDKNIADINPMQRNMMVIKTLFKFRRILCRMHIIALGLC